jgi:hypothetical protein
MLEERKEEIKKFVEIECKDWCKLRLLNIEQVNKKTLLTLIDNDQYEYCVEIGVLRRSRSRKLQLQKFFRNNIYTYDNIINYLKINDKPFVLVTKELNNAIEKIIWNCPIHGEFSMSWNCIKNGQGCPTCGDLSSANSRRNSYEYIKEEFRKKDLVLISEEYINNEEKLDYICNKHKEKGIQKMSSGDLIKCIGCYYCGLESASRSSTKSHDQFCKEVFDVHGDDYIVHSTYINCKSDVIIYCNKCDDIFPIRPDHLLSGHGCSICSSSRGEKRVNLFLDLKLINNIPQYKFKDCRCKRELPFDSYLPDYNTCIEFQGIQHYQPVEIFGGEEQFKLQQMYDNIKRQYCLDNNIKLIEISYKAYNDIEIILTKLLNL